MSTRALANLYCATCKETWIHERNVCRKCGTTNNQSGNPPVPRRVDFKKRAPYNRVAMVHMAESARARKAARAARHNLQRGRT